MQPMTTYRFFPNNRGLVLTRTAPDRWDAGYIARYDGKTKVTRTLWHGLDRAEVAALSAEVIAAPKFL